MKRFFALLAVALLFGGSSFAQKEKVVESSAKKAPEWLGLSTSDYFSVSATAETLDEAQKQCMSDIRQFIITSIAVNITSTETNYQNQTSRNGVTSLLQSYTSQAETTSANIPYLTGLSLSKADEIYWERRMIKSDKRYYYICYVKYPFTERERRDAIAAFKEIDDGYTARLDEIKRNAETFTDLSYIDRAVMDLNPLIAYFFDDTRRNEAQSLQTRYRNMNGEVSLVTESSTIGSFRYHLVLHGRTVTTDKLPKITSDYALNMQIMRDGESCILLYDEQGIAGEENTITLRYSFGGKSLVHTLTFDPLEDKVSVRPFGSALVEKAAGGSWSVTIDLRSRTDNEFAVRSVELRLPELEPLVSSDGETKFKGRGDHHLRFTAAAADTGKRSNGFAEVRIRLYNPKTKIESDIKQILPCRLVR